MEDEKVLTVVNDTKDLVLRELKEFNTKKNVAPNEWQNFSIAVDILEKCMKICHMEKENDYMAYEERTGGAPMHHMPMDSYNYNPHTGMRYSRRTGHSINDRMIDRLERMYDEAQSDHEREVIGSWIDRIRTDSRGPQY